MTRYQFDLNLSKEQIESYYRGSVRWVQTTTLTGQSLRFKLSHLSAYVTHQGVRGRFELVSDVNGDFVSLTRLS